MPQQLAILAVVHGAIGFVSCLHTDNYCACPSCAVFRDEAREFFGAYVVLDAST